MPSEVTVPSGCCTAMKSCAKSNACCRFMLLNLRYVGAFAFVLSAVATAVHAFRVAASNILAIHDPRLVFVVISVNQLSIADCCLVVHLLFPLPGLPVN